MGGKRGGIERATSYAPMGSRELVADQSCDAEMSSRNGRLPFLNLPPWEWRFPTLQPARSAACLRIFRGRGRGRIRRGAARGIEAYSYDAIGS